MTSDPAERIARSFSFGPFVLFPERQLLLKGGKPIRIGDRALDILTTLVERPGEIVDKRELIARVWPSTIVEESNLKVNVVALRKALGDRTHAARYIATVTGRGYRFVAPVQAITPSRRLLAARAHNLPTAISRIFGRTDTIDAVRQDLCEARLVSIVGAGGIGKTTVALAVAHQAVESYGDGVWLVDLGLVKDPASVPIAVATALGLPVHSAAMLAALDEFLRDREVLLILDNCEHVIDAVACWADHVMATTANVKILATSREPLRIKGERVRRLPTLSAPSPASRPSATEALAYPAVQLFVDRARCSFEGYKLSDDDAPAVAEICERLDGLALAIELAATRIESFGVGGLLRQLEDRFRLLVGRRAGPERQRTLAATLEWSYSLLPDRDAALLRAVSVFCGAFDVEDASAVSDLVRAETAERLAQLTAKSLLAVERDAHGVVYRLLETTRAYCFYRLRAACEEQAIRQRHAEHLCVTLERAAIEWAQRPADQWEGAYRRFVDDLREALNWIGRDAANRSLRIRLTVAGLLLWNHFSLTEECRLHVSQAVQDLDDAGLAGTAFEMKLKLWLGGTTMLTSGLDPRALVAMRQALDIAVRTDDTDYHLRCLSMIGVYELFTGAYAAGVRTLQNFASVAAAKDVSALPESEVHTAVAELLLGRLRTARRRLEPLGERDLRYFNGSYGVRYMFDTIVLLESVLSHVQWLTGFPDTAARRVLAAIERARPTNHHVSLNNALSYACPILYWNGRYEECARYVALLDAHVARHGLVTRRPIAIFYRAALAHAKDNRSADAVDGLEQAIEEFRRIKCLARMPYYLTVLAGALVDCGRLGESEATIRAARDTARVQNERWCFPEILRVEASLRNAQCRIDDAEALLEKSMAIAEKAGSLSWRLRSAVDLARLLRDRPRSGNARRKLMSTYNEFTEGFSDRDLLVAAELIDTWVTSRSTKRSVRSPGSSTS